MRITIIAFLTIFGFSCHNNSTLKSAGKTNGNSLDSFINENIMLDYDTLSIGYNPKPIKKYEPLDSVELQSAGLKLYSFLSSYCNHCSSFIIIETSTPTTMYFLPCTQYWSDHMVINKSENYLIDYDMSNFENFINCQSSNFFQKVSNEDFYKIFTLYLATCMKTHIKNMPYSRILKEVDLSNTLSIPPNAKQLSYVIYHLKSANSFIFASLNDVQIFRICDRTLIRDREYKPNQWIHNRIRVIDIKIPN
jgi:hypothetical protein